MKLSEPALSSFQGLIRELRGLPGDQLEAGLKHAAGTASAQLAKAPPIGVGGQPIHPFYYSELALRLLLAACCDAPVGIFEGARQEHQSEAHAGELDPKCEYCGYIMAAVYGAKNPGRELRSDLFGDGTVTHVTSGRAQ